MAQLASCAVLCCVAADTQLRAQQLALRHYDVADGLAYSFIGAIHQDAHSYLWLDTREGLSCFDGYRFTSSRTIRLRRDWRAIRSGRLRRMVHPPL